MSRICRANSSEKVPADGVVRDWFLLDLFLMALIAEMVSVHRGLSEELLYLARQRLYARRRAAGAMAVAKTSPNQVPWQVPAPGVQAASHDVSPVRSLNPRSTVVATEATATSAMHHGGLHLTEG